MNLLCKVNYKNLVYDEVYTENFKSFYNEKMKVYRKRKLEIIFKELIKISEEMLKYNVSYISEKVGWCLCESKHKDIIHLRSGPGYNYIPFDTRFTVGIFEIDHIENGWVKLYNKNEYANMDQFIFHDTDNYFFKGPYKCETIIHIGKFKYTIYGYGLSEEESIVNCKKNICKLKATNV